MKQLVWVGIIAVLGLVIGALVLNSTSPANTDDGSGLFVHPAIKETNVFTPDATGDWLLQISQVHQSFKGSNMAEVSETVAAQKSVADIIKHLKSQDMDLLVCTEGMVDKESWLDELSGEMADIETFRQDVQAAAAQNDAEGVVLGLKAWREFHESNFAPGYAQARLLYALGVAIEEYPAVKEVLPKDLADYASLGQDLFYYSGALKMLVLEDLIKPEDLVACEDVASYEAVGDALSGGDISQSETEVDEANVVRLQEIREDKLLQNMFAASIEDKLMVVILGGYHDLSNNVEAYNQENVTDFGFIEIVPNTEMGM